MRKLKLNEKEYLILLLALDKAVRAERDLYESNFKHSKESKIKEKICIDLMKLQGKIYHIEKE